MYVKRIGVKHHQVLVWFYVTLTEKWVGNEEQ